jgi:branched-chain amino acid aminotransferase
MTLLAVAIAGRGLVDPEEPVFRADDDALLRGGAAFETIRVYGGRPFLLADHLVRFRFSAEALALPAPDGVEEVAALVVGAAPPDHVLRLYRTSQALVAIAATVPPGLDEVRARGVMLKSFEVGAPPPLLGGAKTTSYDVSFAARRAAEQAGADDALLVGEGRVLEGATANVWWRRGDVLYTPAVRPGVLPGVTRAFVRSLEPAHEGEFEVTELLTADEAFLTSSIREVMPVVAVDGARIGDGRPGPAAARLQDALRLRSAT